MARDPASGRDAARPQSGSITVLALWCVALVALLIAGATAATRAGLRVTQNTVAEARVRLAAEAGTQLGLARLLRRRAAGRRDFDGSPELWRDDAVAVEIAILDEAGKIDLNSAPLPLIEGLLAAAAVPQEAALRLACNILAWRGDRNALCPVLTANDRVAFHGRFVVPEQVVQVPGFGEALFDDIADYVTVVTRASAIDPLVAARPDLLAIPGTTPSEVDAFLQSRRDLTGDASFGPAAALPFLTVSPAREFTIRAVAAIASGARYRAELVVRLTDIPSHPYRVLAMRAPPVNRAGRLPPAHPRVP